MVKEGNKRIMINFTPEDLDLLEELSYSFDISKTRIIHYLLTGELFYSLAGEWELVVQKKK